MKQAEEERRCRHAVECMPRMLEEVDESLLALDASICTFIAVAGSNLVQNVDACL